MGTKKRPESYSRIKAFNAVGKLCPTATDWAFGRTTDNYEGGKVNTYYQGTIHRDDFPGSCFSSGRHTTLHAMLKNLREQVEAFEQLKKEEA